MPAHRIVLDYERVRAEAPNHASFASLAKALGWKANSLIKRLEGDETKDEIAALLRGLERTSPGVVPVEEAQEQRIRELEGALRKRRETDVFEERVKAALVESVQAWKPRYTPRPLRKGEHRAKHEMALLWSDLHYPEVVSLEETNGINRFDPDVMWSRLDTLRDRIASHVDQRKYPVDVLHVWALGDMLSGNIHEELAETNDIPLAEATVNLGLEGARWLESLLELGFREIRFAGVVGNHPRFHKKPRAKQAFDNADWIAYHTMKLALQRNEAIGFEIPKATRWPVTLFDRYRVLLWHGDGVRSTMPGVPWGGIMRRAQALQNEYTAADQPIDYFCVGHFHQLNDTTAGGHTRVYMNGSVKGPDEFTLKAFGSGEPPRQALLTFHPEFGSIGGPAYLDLEPRP